MIPTNLYIKQHNKTGKLYFGKTVAPDKTKELWKKNGRDALCNLDWIITTPDGIEHLVNGLRPWCRENNVNFYQVYYQRNGWKSMKNGKSVRSRTKNKRKVYVD